MAEATLQYNSISLGSRGGVSNGFLKLTPAGFSWRRQQGGKVMEVRKDDIESLVWTRLGSRGCQLGVRRAEGPTINFLGFRDKDQESLAGFCRDQLGRSLGAQELSISGRNWGDVDLNSSSLLYKVDGKVMFEVPLPDVAQAQQTKDEVLLEFHADDTTHDDREDTLLEMAFHVPPSNVAWMAAAQDAADAVPEGEEPVAPATAAKALVDALLQHTDAGVATSDDAVAIFEEVAVLAPRGRFSVEMHATFFKLVGQTQDFKIRYTSVSRVFILPKSASPHTLAVIALDPAIRKGQTFYSFLLCQFNNADEMTLELDMSDELLAQKNEKCGNKLSRTLTGPVHTVFAHTLRGLSGAKITRAKSEVYTNQAGEGCAVRCSYKADDGYLYPLDKAFFYVHKPPMCINHNDIEYVEFQRQGGGVVSSSVRTFDLLVKQRSSNTEYQFRNIQRSEWEPLFEFINQRKIKIENLAEARHGPRGPGAGLDLGDELDAGMRAAAAEADEEDETDEDFDAGGESSQPSSGGSSDEAGEGGSEAGSSDAEMIDEEGIAIDAVLGSHKGGRKRKGGSEEPAGSEGGEADAAAAKPKAKKAKKAPKAEAEAGAAAGGEEGGDEEAPAKKKRKKKDPNAPKKATSAFFYFSQANRERVKAANPEAPFGQIAKLLGEEWKAISAEDKAQYEEKAARDKERYAAEMADYNAGKAADGRGSTEAAEPGSAEPEEPAASAGAEPDAE